MEDCILDHSVFFDELDLALNEPMGCVGNCICTACNGKVDKKS